MNGRQRDLSKGSRLDQQLDLVVAERLGIPEQVKLYDQFEELSRTYAIEAPFVPRTRLSLAFAAYDGKKLRLNNFLDEEDEQTAESETLNHNETGDELAPNAFATQLNEIGPKSTESTHLESKQHRLSKHQLRSTNGRAKRQLLLHLVNGKRNDEKKKIGNLSWCKSLFNRRQGSRLFRKQISCLTRSDTTREFVHLSPSASQVSGAWHSMESPSCDALAMALPSGSVDDELRREAVQLLGQFTSHLSSGLYGRSDAEQMIEQQVDRPMLADMSSEFAGEVTVCLMDKRSSYLLGNSLDEAGEAKRWAQVNFWFENLRAQVRDHFATITCDNDKNNDNLNINSYRDFEHKMEKLIEKRLSNLNAFKKSNSRFNKRKILMSKEQIDRVIELTKDNLNHLIDAQLLLRNKLSNDIQQQQPTTMNSSSVLATRAYEYDLLLRNNFNLLKVWQNLEETKHLVCFVCEPIKANLNDLFWFNRQLGQSVYFSQMTKMNAHHMLMISPLVSLDSGQIKRGILQILEALSYLHTICKLVHRNLNPRNILIAANDNWKLSGLDFAVRFESTAISESASMMAHEASTPLLRYSFGLGSGSQGPLRRQRTLHQTKCQEIVKYQKSNKRKPKVEGNLQPELDYLAPEIWKSAKCSHKSDLFSFGLILGQVYDLGRHRSPINCRGESLNYETELRKLESRGKRRLSRLVPMEMRAMLLEMLDTEPNLRPSASFALQLFRRPMELCKSNEDSLRHLRSSMSYLDSSSQLRSSAASGAKTNFSSAANNNGNGASGGLNTEHQQSGVTNGIGLGKKRRASYFRKVTASFYGREQEDQLEKNSSSRRLTRSLQLLNLLLRALDVTLANKSRPAMNQQQAPSDFCDSNQQRNPQMKGVCDFFELKLEFEFTIETLKQLYRCGQGTLQQPDTWQQIIGPDQRMLLMAIALHRRLLGQVSQMRQSVPPVSRLMGANALTDGSAQKHRILGQLEDRLYHLVSRHSIGNLASMFADPLLKLDEFILVYELIGDLVAFVGQRSRRNFILRAKQLLNDLTPVTGCPSSSSSDEDESGDSDLCHFDPLRASTLTLAGLGCSSAVNQQQANARALLGSGVLVASGGNVNSALGGANRMSTHRYSDYDSRVSSSQRSPRHSFQMQPPARPQASVNSNHLMNLPATTISITAPSPMGSMRDINARTRDTPPDQSAQVMVGRQFNRQDEQMLEMTKQMNLNGSKYWPRNTNGDDFEHQSDASDFELDKIRADFTIRHNDSFASFNLNSRAEDQETQGIDKELDKSRSQLMDELLRTINDDNFNDVVDLGNKYTASNCSTNSTFEVQNRVPSAMELANQNRPKSAIDGGTNQNNSKSNANSTYCSPTTSALGAQNQRSRTPNASNQLHQHRSSATPSTFDSVIRRMSTNLVQNFNKMSGSTLGTNEQPDLHVRREKSSNYANSLYVDNQVPARRHSDNTINIPRIQVALSSPQGYGSRSNLNQRASVSASKLANKWKLTAKTNQREASDKLSPNLGGALGYMRRHSSGNTTNNDQNTSNGTFSGSTLNIGTSPFKVDEKKILGCLYARTPDPKEGRKPNRCWNEECAKHAQVEAGGSKRSTGCNIM